MKRMFDVSIVRNSWWGCLRPPCGGTEAVVPSRIFRSACWTPSPDTSRVIDGVVGLARDLVDLVDVDDPRLGLLHVEVGGLDQLQEDVLDVLADVAGLGQRRGVGDRERDVEDPGEGLRKQRLATAGRAEQEDVRLLQLDVGLDAGGLRHLDPLVVVVDRDRERPLADSCPTTYSFRTSLISSGLRQALELERGGSGELLVDDLVAEVNALVADVDARAGDQLLDLALRLAAEAAEELLVGVRSDVPARITSFLLDQGSTVSVLLRPEPRVPSGRMRKRMREPPAHRATGESLGLPRWRGN